MEALQPYMNLIYLGIGVLVLLLLLLVAIRLLGRSVRGRKGSRLGISEYYEIDKSRRLVLVRRDDMEHLVLIGGNQDVVIESDIGSPLASASAAPAQVIRPAPRPAVFTGRRPTLRPVETLEPRSNRDEPQM
jgi:Na+-transporting methylmalonyl-CoA/oxaloacetate decarboxylase gamma subunit